MFNLFLTFFYLETREFGLKIECHILDSLLLKRIKSIIWDENEMKQICVLNLDTQYWCFNRNKE